MSIVLFYVTAFMGFIDKETSLWWHMAARWGIIPSIQSMSGLSILGKA